MAEEPKHARLSASGSPTWMVCAAAPKMQEAFADRGSSYAAEGTAAHEIAARCLRDGLDAASFCGLTIEVEDVSGDAHIPQRDGPSTRDPETQIRTFECTPEMADSVQIFVDAVRARKGDDLLVETRVDYSHYVPDGFGTVDAGSVSIAGRTLYVDDLKYGRNIKVDARTHPGEQLHDLGTPANPQQLLYGVAMLLDVDLFYEIDTVVVGIHQPRMDHVDEYAISRHDLLAWADNVVRPAAQRAADADTSLAKYFAPGEKTCQWCSAKHVCFYRQSWLLEAASADFDAVPLPEDLATLEDDLRAASAPTGAVSLADMAAMLPRLRALGTWANNVRAYLTAEAEAGVEIPGHKLVGTLGNRTWADPAKAEGAIKREVGAANAYSKTLLTPPALEKLVGKGHRLLSDKYVVRPDGKPTLVPADDPRPAVKAVAAEGFGEVPE